MRQKQRQFVVALIGDEALVIEAGKELIRRGHSISLLASRSDEVNRWASQVSTLCEPDLRDHDSLLYTESFDLLLSITNYQIVPAELIAKARVAAINFHDGPLPDYSGRNVTTWSILNNESEHGVTWHLMDPQADIGAVLNSQRFPIESDETAWSLNLRCFEVGLDSFSSLMDQLEEGLLQPKDQDIRNRNVFHSWDRPFVGGLIDGESSADEIVQLTHALDFGHTKNPLCVPKLLGSRSWVSVEHALASECNSESDPGTIIEMAGDELRFATSTTDVVLGGFRSVSGQTLTGKEALIELDLAVGKRVSASPASRALEPIWKEIARNEFDLANVLARLNPISLPNVVSSESQLIEDDAITYTCSAALRDSGIGTDVATVISTAWLSFVCRTTGRNCFDIAYTSAGLRNVVSVCPRLFSPVVPLRILIDEADSPASLYNKLKESIAVAESHGPIAIDIGLRYPELRGNPSSCNAMSLPVGLFMGDTPDDARSVTCSSQYWMSVNDDGEARIHGNIDQSDSQIVAIGRLFDTFSAQMAAHDDAPIATIPLIADAAADQKRSGNVGRSVDLSSYSSVIDLIDFGHNKTAVCDVRSEHSYADIHRRSSQIAEYLIGEGAVPGQLIGVMSERSAELICILLGIWKAGCAYLPLDPSFPTERIEFMIADSATKLILSSGENKPSRQSDDVAVIDTEQIDTSKTPNLDRTCLATDSAIAYVIYTSGSTGKPKGVSVSHRNAVNFLLGMSIEPGLSATDTFVAVTTTSFDISVLELFLPLVCGARVVIPGSEAVSDGPALADILRTNAATAMQATPSTWRMLLDAGWTGQSGFKVLCGGEPLPLDLARELIHRCGEVWNMYGPTETTVWSTCKRLDDPNQPISIGRPIANTEVYIVNDAGLEQPAGIPGELCIGGEGVAPGYLNRQDLTDERFVWIPHLSSNRLYRSGDLARWNQNGELEHLGRIDSQVKIRGFRIELGEIEYVLSSITGIERAVVSVWEPSPNDTRLVAYFVPQAGYYVAKTELRKAVRKSLPSYMVPQFFVEISEIPMTLNGKIDRKQLPQPQVDSDERKELPETTNERLIAAVWTKVLGMENIGRFDNFFELGGHSLLAASVAKEIECQTGKRIELRRFVIENLGQLADELADEQVKSELQTGWSKRLLDKFAGETTGQ